MENAGGFVNGREDARVGAAAADIPLHGRENFLFRRIAIGIQERYGGDDHARSAIGALHCAFIEEGLLDGVEMFAPGQAFDGGDLLAFGGGEREEAGTARLAVNQNGARAALAFAAAVLASG